VDSETHFARRNAHEAFDPIWKQGKLSRSEAYKRLARVLQMTRKECHIKKMDADTARRVPSVARQIARQEKGPQP
jgi:hypothetical protein